MIVIARFVMSVALVAVLAACGGTQDTPSPVTTPAVVAVSPAGTSAPTASPSVKPSPTPTPAPTATPTPTPKPTPTPWKTYKSKRNDYTIKYPPTWIVTPGTAKLPDAFDDFQHFVYVDRDTVSGTVSLNLTQTAEINFMKSHYHAKVLAIKHLTVAGWPARLIIFNAERDGRKSYIQALVLGKGSVAYFLVWWSDRGNAVADRSFFRKIYLTFRPT